MRVSIVKADPGYRWNAKSYRVKLDGEEAKWVLTADEEEGLVVRYVLDEAGKPKIGPDGQSYVTEQVAGHVEVYAVNAAGENVRLPKVKVERNAEGHVEVLVYSRVKPGSIRRATLDEKTMDHRRWTPRAAVSVLAGGAAEDLIKSLGDSFEPSDVAKLAGEEYERLVRTEQVKH